MYLLIFVSASVSFCIYLYKKGIFSLLTAILLSRFFVKDKGDHVVIDYPFGYKWYKLVLPKNIRGPRNCNISSNGKNIDSIYEKYAGPFRNFNHLTPRYMGLKSIDVSNVFGGVYTFEDDDKIQL